MRKGMRAGPCRAAAIAVAAGLAVVVSAAPLAAQPAPWPTTQIEQRHDSGLVEVRDGRPAVAAVKWETIVAAEEAAWVRVIFDEVSLSGVIEEGSAAWLRLTSLTDGGQQFLNAESLAQWEYTSAYFNGPAVRVELLGHVGAGPSRVAITGLIVGALTEPMPRSICDGVDLRELSSDLRVGRGGSGCTLWLLNDTNNMFGSAGHCSGHTSEAHFNVPLSTSSGSMQFPPPEDQYPRQASSIHIQNSGVGLDWMYFACHRNSNTGLTAYQTQGQSFVLAPEAPPVGSQLIRVTGHGIVSSPVPPEWNRAQKTHAGEYVLNSGTTLRYRPDTTSGNSGSPVIDDSTGLAIGVHTHGGCTSSGGSNAGTAIHHSGWQAALANPQGLARSGWWGPDGTLVPQGPVHLIGDVVNNFGTVNTTTGHFSKVTEAAPWMQGLAYDPDEAVFYAVNHNSFTNERRLYLIDEATGESTFLADISGTTAVINGLGFDSAAGILYGISQANGQLFRITVEGTSIGEAIAIGAPGGGTVSGIDYSLHDGLLYGVDRSTTPARLVAINTASGQQTLVGSLGGSPAISDVRGLAADEHGDLWTIEAGSAQLVQIDSQTGAGTRIGATDATFGNALGLAAVIPPGDPPALRMSFPGGLPFLIPPGQEHPIAIEILTGTQVLVPGSANVHYRTSPGGPFTAITLSHAGGNEYAGLLPAFACGDEPQIYFSAEGDGGGTALLPRNAPDSVYTTSIGVLADEAIIEQSFEVSWPTGWWATGLWHINHACAPAGNVCAQAPHAYFGRTTTCNYNFGTAVSGELTGPEVSIPALPPGGKVTLTFCYALETEEHAFFDRAELFINGQTRPEWELDDVHPTPGEPDRYWATPQFDLSEFAGEDVTVSFRFDSVTGMNNHFRGWHLNNVRLEATVVTCDDPACYADCDDNQVLNINDFLCFIDEFAAASQLPIAEQISHYANCDGATAEPVLTINDFLCFIDEFAQGCP